MYPVRHPKKSERVPHTDILTKPQVATVTKRGCTRAQESKKYRDSTETELNAAESRQKRSVRSCEKLKRKAVCKCYNKPTGNEHAGNKLYYRDYQGQEGTSSPQPFCARCFSMRPRMPPHRYTVNTYAFKVNAEYSTSLEYFVSSK